MLSKLQKLVLVVCLLACVLAAVAAQGYQFERHQEEFPEYINEEDTLYPPGHGHHEDGSPSIEDNPYAYLEQFHDFNEEGGHGHEL